nr:MAG TPA: hypothetical protein [Caudoviricetes sp.]
MVYLILKEATGTSFGLRFICKINNNYLYE